MIRRIFAVCLVVAFAAAALSPVRAAGSFTIGIMNDESGPYADLAGPGSVEMARMADAFRPPGASGCKLATP